MNAGLRRGPRGFLRWARAAKDSRCPAPPPAAIVDGMLHEAVPAQIVTIIQWRKALLKLLQ